MIEFLTELWQTNIDYILPIIGSAAGLLLPTLAYYLKKKLDVATSKLDLSLESSSMLLSKDMGIEKIDKLENHVGSKLDDVVRNQKIHTEYLDVAFQNANLDPEVKETLKALKNNLTFGEGFNRVVKLEEENEELKKAIEQLQEQQKDKKKIKKEDTKESTKVRS